MTLYCVVLITNVYEMYIKSYICLRMWLTFFSIILAAQEQAVRPRTKSTSCLAFEQNMTDDPSPPKKYRADKI